MKSQKHRSYCSDHYRDNREYYLERNRQRADLFTSYVNNSKDTPCMDCGLEYPPYVMDFDHRPDQEKCFNIGTKARRVSSLSKLEIEIAKCDVVCSNCHRIRTYGGD